MCENPEKIEKLAESAVNVGDESKIVCPVCEKNDELCKVSDQHTMFQMFIARPLDDYHCLRCGQGFCV